MEHIKLSIRSIYSSAMLIIIAAIIASCSSLESSKLDLSTLSKSGTELPGIPFTINKPVPTVTRISGDGSKADTYTIKFDYVPDPNGRFTLKIDPSILSSISFNMTFDANGSLVDTTAKSTDQTGTIITSIGKVALAASILDKSETKDAEALNNIDKQMINLLSASGTQILDPTTGSKRSVKSQDLSMWAELIDRLKKYEILGKIKTEFYYQNETEYALLKTLLESRKYTFDPTYNKNNYQLYSELKKKVVSQTNGLAISNKIDTAMKEMDLDALKSIRTALIAERNDLIASYEEDISDSLSVNLSRINLVKAASNLIDPSDILLANLAQISSIEWQKRVVLDLNKKINDRRLQLRIAASGERARITEDTDNNLNQLYEKKAIVLGVQKEALRRKQINNSLLTTKNAKDIKHFRSELASLDSILLSTETALKAKSEDTAKPSEAVLAEFLVDKESEMDSNFLIEKFGKKPPKYIVVLRPLGKTSESNIKIPAVKPPPVRAVKSDPEKLPQDNDAEVTPPNAVTPPPKDSATSSSDK